MKPNGLEIFEAVVRQVDLPSTYTAGQLKDDLLLYMNENSDYFTVTDFTCLFFVRMPKVVTNK